MSPIIKIFEAISMAISRDYINLLSPEVFPWHCGIHSTTETNV